MGWVMHVKLYKNPPKKFLKKKIPAKKKFRPINSSQKCPPKKFLQKNFDPKILQKNSPKKSQKIPNKIQKNPKTISEKIPKILKKTIPYIALGGHKPFRACFHLYSSN